MKKPDSSKILRSENFMVYKNKEIQKINPIFDIIKKKYGFLNVFLIFFSIILMGLFRTLQKQYAREKKLFLFLFIMMLIFLFVNLFLLIKKIKIKELVIIWPTRKTIFYYIIQVVIFTIILVCVVSFFDLFYNYLIKI